MHVTGLDNRYSIRTNTENKQKLQLKQRHVMQNSVFTLQNSETKIEYQIATNTENQACKAEI